MKILSLSTVQLLPHLGSGKTRSMWTQGLRNLGHDVTVLQPSDFEFLPIIKKATQLRSAIGIFFSVRKALKKNRYDIIEFYGDQYWLLLLWIKRLQKTNRPVLVAHVDGLELLDMKKALQYYKPRNGFKRWLYINTHFRFAQLTFNLADKFICGSLDDLNYVIQNNIFSKNDAFCVSPGIDNQFHNIPFIKGKEKVITFLGTWNVRKGINNIPEVITKILQKNPEHEFHIFGAWSSKKVIYSMFPEELKGRIVVFGKLSSTDLYEGITKAGIFFFPSYSEGFGLATVEAMSCSCAVVTTKTGVGCQLVNKKNALLVNFDDKEAMVSAINLLINNEHLRLELAYSGYQKAKEFQWGNQIELLERHYLNWQQN